MSPVRHVRPDKGCLWCSGLVDPSQLVIEAETDSERRAQAYGIREPNSSVITLNSVAAALAVDDFLFDLLVLRTGEVGASYNNFHVGRGGTVRVEPRRSEDCLECVGRLAMGDAVELPVTEG